MFLVKLFIDKKKEVMNVKNWPLILFVLGSIFQWYILSGWISRSEQVISKGIYAKIPCRQVDPIDPFRGAYLTVNPDPAVFELLYTADRSKSRDAGTSPMQDILRLSLSQR